MLKEAYEKYAYISPIRDVVTDHAFENFCDGCGINLILALVKHPQTNGKMERWFQTYQKIERDSLHFSSL